MNIVEIVDKMSNHLNQVVFDGIRLKRQEESDHDFSLVKPTAYSFYLPAQIIRSQDERLKAPTVIVSPEGDWIDDGTKFTGVIQMTLCVYNPGDHLPGKKAGDVNLELGTEGWRDLANLMDRIKADLLSRRFVEGVNIGVPWKEGFIYPSPDYPQHYPYHYGYLQFTVSAAAYPAADLSEYL